MKRNLFILILFFPYIALSQSFQVYNITEKNFPTISANFFYFNADGQQVTNFSIKDFEVLENGEKRKVVSVSCPQAKEPIPLSSVLVIDVSGSMASGKGNVPNIELAKEGARVWVNTLPLGKSECAITAFDSYNYLIQDFTIDKAKLLEGIDKLAPKGGTDYDMALIKPPAGGLLVASNGKHKRVVVFLTDGMPNKEPQVDRIIQMANQNNVTIYAVILGMPCPESVKKITNETGGLWFENVNNTEEVRKIYHLISSVAQNNEPCTIEWISQVTCSKAPIDVTFRLIKYGLTSQNQYYPLQKQIAKLKIEPYYIVFKNKEINKIHDTTVKITAINSDFVVKNISSSDPNFLVTPNSFALKNGETITLTVKHRPTDSVYSFATFLVDGTPCETQFYATSVYTKYSKKTTKLRVVHPNGGEVFVVGSDTLITWEGIPPNETVSLEYSTDGGATWKFIDTASGLSYKWKNIPKPASNKCLVRVTRIKGDNQSKLKTIPLGNKVFWQSNGNQIVTSGGNSITILEPSTLDTIKTLTMHKGLIISYRLNSDGSLLVSTDGNDVFVLDLTTGDIIFKQVIKTMRTSSVDISPDNKYIAYSQDNKITIWDIQNDYLINSLELANLYQVYVTSVQFCPDNETIVCRTHNNNIFFYNFKTKETVRRISGTISHHIFTRDGKFFVYQAANTVNIFDLQKNDTIKTFKTYSIINTYAISPSGKYLAIASDSVIKVYDTESEKEIANFKANRPINCLVFSSDENYLVSSDYINVTVWDLTSKTVIASKFGHSNEIYALAVSPDGKTIATNCYGFVLFWDTDANFLGFLQANNDYVVALSFSPDTKYLATGGGDYLVNVWEVKNKTLINTFKNSANAISIKFSPDSKYLAISWNNQSIQIYDVASWSLIQTLKSSHNAYDFEFAPQGNLLVSIHSNNELKIWNFLSGAEIWTQKIVKDNWSVNSFDLDPKGNIIAIGIHKQIFVYSFNDLKQIATIDVGEPYIRSVSISPNVNFLASSDSKGLIKVWETNNFSLTNTLYGHTRTVPKILFLPDGYKLVSCGYDAIMRIWDFDLAPPETDISDSLFSIVEPLAAAKDIDMGTCLVNAIKDSLVNEFVVNTGSFPFRVDSIYFDGVDASAFSLVSGLPKYIVASGRSHFAEFRFAPKRIGLHTANIVIITQADTLKYTIRGEGVENNIAISNGIIDFGKVLLGEFKDTIQVPTITNIGTTPITILSTKIGFPNDKDFIILDGGGSFTLQPGETKTLDLRFQPSDVGRTSSTLLFYYNGANSPAVVQMFGEGVFAGTASARIRTLELQGYPGDTISVPIILDTAENLLWAGVRTIDVDLFFNPTILLPRTLPVEIIDVQTAKVRVKDLPANKKPGETLKEVPFFVALGNATQCPLILKNAETHGGTAEISLLSGWFRLLGVCFEGGARLVNPYSEVGILKISPNPSDDEITIEISLTESGRTQLNVYNYLGEKVSTLFDQIVQKPTKKEIKIKSRALPPGQYILQLQTPSFIQNEIICIFN